MGRVRETLFAWLGPTLPGARVLDLFAGTGALGFEALSRGAAHATFVERDRGVAQGLRASAQRLGAEADCAAVAVASASAWLQRQREWKWDVAFVDPPFASRAAAPVLALLQTRNVTVYLEESNDQRAGLSGWEALKEGRVGACRFRLLRPEAMLQSPA